MEEPEGTQIGILQQVIRFKLVTCHTKGIIIQQLHMGDCFFVKALLPDCQLSRGQVFKLTVLKLGKIITFNVTRI
jgi:hypothetical protein